MELAVNGLRLMGQRLGVGRYIEYLLRNWECEPSPFTRIAVYSPGPFTERVDLPKRAEHRVVSTRGPQSYWEQVVLPRAARDQDVLFCPSYVAPFRRRSKTVVTHHGSYEAVPDAFPLAERWKSRALYTLSAHRADRVITVSESAKQDIVRFYRVKPEKVVVIPPGVDPSFRAILGEDRKRATRLMYAGGGRDDRPYILFVGKLSKRRQIPELVAAFAKLKRERHLSHALVLIGPDSSEQNLAQLAKTAGVAGDVIHRVHASHDELVDVYNAADLFIYPSLYEGFGMPVLEAMACGVPTIALRNTSFLEFADGAAYLAPEAGEAALFEAMDTVLHDQELRARLREAGPERARDYQWSGIARRTMDVLLEVVNR